MPSRHRGSPGPDPKVHADNMAAAQRVQQELASGQRKPGQSRDRYRGSSQEAAPPQTESQFPGKTESEGEEDVDEVDFTRHRAGMKAALKNPRVKPERKEQLRSHLDQEEREGRPLEPAVRP